jgi:hypothetical protein
MKYLYGILVLTSLFSISCQPTQQSYVHTITDLTGLQNTEHITYTADFVGVGITGALTDLANADALVSQTLATGDIAINKVDLGNYTITISGQDEETSIAEIPSKYINLDATIEISRNVFQSYFPAEWEPMKGSNYTSLRILSKKDAGVFFIKAVYTGTHQEIGKYAEDF